MTKILLMVLRYALALTFLLLAILTFKLPTDGLEIAGFVSACLISSWTCMPKVVSQKLEQTYAARESR